jgi:hypothetical protein
VLTVEGFKRGEASLKPLSVLGLGTVAVGAFSDEKVRKALPVGELMGACSGLVVPYAKDDEYTYHRNIDYGAQSERE